MDARWYALQVRPRAERSCEIVLLNKGYEVFVPRYVPVPGQRRASRFSEKSLFPGYLFCRSTANSVGKMVLTPGAIRLLGLGNRPEAIPDVEMDTLRRIAESGVPRRPWMYLREGSVVEIGSGPLTGVKGVLISGADSRRLVVSVTLLQRSVATELDEATVLLPIRSGAPTAQPRTEGIATYDGWLRPAGVSGAVPAWEKRASS